MAGRPRSSVRRTALTVRIDERVDAAVTLLLTDPVRRKPKHGAKSRLVEQLLTEWLRRQQSTPRTPSAAPESVDTSGSNVHNNPELPASITPEPPHDP